MKKKQRALRTRVTTRKKESNKLGMFAIIVVSMIIVVAICIQNNKLEDKLNKLKAEEQEYAELVEEEENRTLELEERAKYVNTKAYIEEAAKKLGFVYPDEIILKPKE